MNAHKAGKWFAGVVVSAIALCGLVQNVRASLLVYELFEFEPEEIGSMGGNVGLVDGSVEWRNQRAVHPRYVFWAPTPGDGIIGYC